jgi:hypothetical protein
VPRDLIRNFLEEKRNPKDGGESLVAQATELRVKII